MNLADTISAIKGELAEAAIRSDPENPWNYDHVDLELEISVTNDKVLRLLPPLLQGELGDRMGNRVKVSIRLYPCEPMGTTDEVEDVDSARGPRRRRGIASGGSGPS